MSSQSQPWSLPFRYFIGILLLIVFMVLLVYAREAVKALVTAGFIAYLISPLVSLLMDHTKLSRIAAVNVVYFTALVLLVSVPAALTPIFLDEIKIVASDLLNLSHLISEWLTQPKQFGSIIFHFEQLGESFDQLQGSILTPLPAEALALLETTSVNLLWFLVILVCVHLFMTEWPRIRDWLVELAPPAYRDDMRELYRRLRDVWMAYLRGQIVLMIIVGVVFTIAWFVIGIPGALVLGMIAGFFTLVPDVGPFIAAALAFGVALLEGSNWAWLSSLPNFWVAGIVAIVYVVLISVKNFWLRPFIMGRSVHMNEALVFIVIMAATILGGIMGALLIVPVLASAVVLFEYLRCRVLGLTPFDDDGSQQFMVPPEKIKPPRRIGELIRKKRKKVS